MDKRRDWYQSSAQVAYYYGYTVEYAMALTSAQRRWLLNTVVGEQDRQWLRMEGLLGTQIDVESLMAPPGNGNAPPPKLIRTSVIQALGLDYIQGITKHLKAQGQARAAREAELMEMGIDPATHVE